jgi:hypothetical protein
MLDMFTLGDAADDKFGSSAPIDMFLSAVSVLVVVQLSSGVSEGLMNNPVLITCICVNVQNRRMAFKNSNLICL